ncbi:LysM peptidoglycan-binding domain-containing protein [Paenibacillus pinihumi]|uniref:LysM peptidoglycan-binding domain-containing protein n=1 Tax=Paenibacillus pinihumi TaxID=669462 RepID=UPI00040BD219|nr:LysM peptidoglycan-binding domain-containing protein [Paenibacillus pinihumi]
MNGEFYYQSMNELRPAASSMNSRKPLSRNSVMDYAERVLFGRPGKLLVRGMLAVLLMSFLFSFLFLVQSNASNHAEDAERAAGVSDNNFVIVTAGDSLWDIAKRHKPEETELRQFIYELQRFNQLSSSSLNAGDVIEIPAQ